MLQHLKMLLLPVYAVLIAFNYQVSAQDQLVFATTTASTPTVRATPTARPVRDWVLVNNRPAVGTMRPFVSAPEPSQQYIECFARCPTTPEYNPICGSNMQLYLNEQKFNCARFCGANIQIVRRGGCEGLFTQTQG